MTTVEHSLDQFNAKFRQYSELYHRTCVECLAKQGKEFSGFLYSEMKALAPQKGATRARILGWLQKKDNRKGLRIHNQKMPNPLGGGMIGQGQHVSNVLHGQYDQSRKSNRVKTKAAKELFATLQPKLAKFDDISPLGDVNQSRGGKLAFQALLVENEIARRESKRMFAAIAVKMGGDFKSGTASKSGSDELGKWIPTIKQNDAEGTFTWGSGVGKGSWVAARALVTAIGQSAITRALQATQANMQVKIDELLKEQGKVLA